MGLIVGSIGIGATCEGPLVQVDRFPACERVFATGISVAALTGDGRGAMFSFPGAWVGVRVVFSVRPIRDFLNHDDLDDKLGVFSDESFDPL